MSSEYKLVCSLTYFFLLKVLLVVGGQAPKAIRSVECYDFSTETWSSLAEMPGRRCRAGLVVLAGRVYAVGGFNGSLRVRTVDVYDTTQDQWTVCAGMEARRSTLGVAVLNNCIYAVSCAYILNMLTLAKVTDTLSCF